LSDSQNQLTHIVLQDLWKHKRILSLAFFVFLNAIVVVYTTHVSRENIGQLDQMLQSQDSLDIEWRNLLLEEQSQSEHSRITRFSTKELSMHRPLPKEEVVVRID